MRKFQLAVAVLFFALLPVVAQTNPPSSAEVEKRVNTILSKMSLREKIDYLGGVEGFYIRAMPSLGLPAFKMADGPYGVRNYGPSTTLSGGIGLAATWDTELVHHAGVVLGEDARARGVHFLLGPGVNIYRAPMNGTRNFEYFGEDPFLASRTAVAYIEGVQSKDVCATIKHFMGNNSEYDRHNTDSLIDERTMREIYLPTFEAAVKEAHVCAIMDSYNLTNGEHLTQNGYLNNDVVKKDWGFDGIIMSDWDSTYDGVAAANGGLDLEMPSGKFMNRKVLLPAIKDGKVSEAAIDEHVRRILRKAIQFGWLDHAQTDRSIPLYNMEGRSVSLQAARESLVLLKNSGNLLPLDKTKIKTLAIIGPDAYPGQPVGGGSAGVQPFHAISYLEGLASYLGEGVKVFYLPGIASRSDLADSTEYVTEPTGGQAGLKTEYFKTRTLSGTPETGVAPHVNYTWNRHEHSGMSSEYLSARWTGYYIAKDAGTFDAFVEGTGEDGGYRLFVDDKLVINSWDGAMAQVGQTTLSLTSGAHKVRLEFFRRSGNRSPRMAIVSASAIVQEEAKSLAAKADAVVLAVGFDPESEAEGADRTFRLPPGQDELIQSVLAVNKNVVIDITSGGGVDMTPWLDRAPAVLQSWYSGQEGGTALAQLIFGDYSPSGKLPVTFDRRWEDNASSPNYYPNAGDKKVKYTEGIFLGYRHYDKSGIKPLFPFGFGLSYTTFKYSNLAISPGTTSGNSLATVSFDVTNTGTREGAEIAELYVGDTHSSVPRPVKELKGFARVNLKPGETQKVTIPLDRRAFSYYDVKAKQWKAEPGQFTVLVGSSSDKVELTGPFNLAK